MVITGGVPGETVKVAVRVISPPDPSAVSV